MHTQRRKHNLLQISNSNGPVQPWAIAIKPSLWHTMTYVDVTSPFIHNLQHIWIYRFTFTLDLGLCIC